jgi:hypothetical protein
MDEMAIQLIGAISSAITSLSVVASIITGIILLAPQHRQLRAEAIADALGAELNRIRIMNVNQAELRETLAETREEMANIKLSGTKRLAMNGLIGIRPVQLKETVSQPSSRYSHRGSSRTSRIAVTMAGMSRVAGWMLALRVAARRMR